MASASFLTSGNATFPYRAMIWGFIDIFLLRRKSGSRSRPYPSWWHFPSGLMRLWVRSRSCQMALFQSQMDFSPSWQEEPRVSCQVRVCHPPVSQGVLGELWSHGFESLRAGGSDWNFSSPFEEVATRVGGIMLRLMQRLHKMEQ